MRLARQATTGSIALAVGVASYVAAHYITLGFMSAYRSTILDELASFILLPVAALFSFSRSGRLAAVFFLIYAIILGFGAFLHQYGGVPQPNAALLAIALDAKVVILAFALSYFSVRSTDPDQMMRMLSLTFIAAAAVNFPFVVADFVRGQDLFGVNLVYKGGLPQPRGLVKHHTEVAWLYSFAGLAAFALYRKSMGAAYLLIGVLCSVIVFMTLSTKEIVGFCAGTLVIFGAVRRGQYRSVVFAFMAAAMFLTALIATPIGNALAQHVGMFMGESAIPTVRGAMAAASVDIATEHFPWGAGGGTFGSAPSYQLGYSDLYVTYGIYALHGGSPIAPYFLQDMFWAKVLAEGGWLGLISYAVLLVFLGRRLFSPVSSSGRYAGLARAFVIVIGMISLGSSPLTNQLLLFVLAVAFSYGFGRHI